MLLACLHASCIFITLFVSCVHALSIQVGIYYPSRVQYYLPPSGAEKKVIKGITTASYSKVGKGVVMHKQMLRHVLQAIGHVLQDEAYKVASYMASVRPANEPIFMAFSWANLHRQFQMRCPNLLRILSLALPSQKRSSLYPCLCVIIAILAKANNKKADLVQLLLSLVLLYGHASSQVGSYYACMYTVVWKKHVYICRLCVTFLLF